MKTSIFELGDMWSNEKLREENLYQKYSAREENRDDLRNIYLCEDAAELFLLNPAWVPRLKLSLG